MFAAKNPKTAQRGAFMGGALTLFTVLPTSMLGIVAFYFLPGDIAPLAISVSPVMSKNSGGALL